MDTYDETLKSMEHKVDTLIKKTPSTFVFRTYYIYIIIPLTILVMFIIFQPLFVSTIDKTTETYHLSIKKMIKYDIIITSILLLLYYFRDKIIAYIYSHFLTK